MSDIKELEARLAHLQKELEERNDPSVKYFRSVVHQLKSVAPNVRWNMESFRDEQNSSTDRFKSLMTVYSIIIRAIKIVRDFRLMSDLDCTEDTSQSREAESFIDVLSMIVHAVEDFTPCAREVGKRIEIQHGVFRKVWGGKKLVGVESYISQAFVNLLDNALKYADPQSVIHVSAQQTEDGAFGLEVTSKGVPIDGEDIPRLTEEGYRGKYVKNIQGTGMGLYIVFHVMRIHGGKFLALPNGSTSTFILVFPKERIV